MLSRHPNINTAEGYARLVAGGWKQTGLVCIALCVFLWVAVYVVNEHISMT